MFNLESSIAEWRQQMLAAGIKTPVPLEELESHLREEIEGQIQSGMDEERAFRMAVKNVGPAEPLKTEFRTAGFLNWLGDDKNTRINRAFAFFWLIYCGWATWNIGHACVVWIIDGVHGIITGTEGFGVTRGLFLALLLGVVFVRGLIASLRVIRGKNQEIRVLKFIAALGVAMLVAQIVTFKRFSPVDVTLLSINVASLFLMRLPPPKDSKTTSI
jgi:hypothetical protein